MNKGSALQKGNQLLRGIVAAVLFAASAPADDYVVTVDEADTRLARVVATLVPDGDVIAMNDEGNQGLERGWATFVEDLKVTDEKGNALLAAPEKNSRWRLTGYSGGPVKVSYTVRLKHDQVSLNFGDNGAAYANSFGVMWAGRALFIAGRSTREVTVRFDLPKEWHVTTPWEPADKNTKVYAPRGTDDLVNSAFFAGTHITFDLTVGTAAIRFALAGTDVMAMRDNLSEMTGKYLRYYDKTYGPAPASHMLLIASDSSYWGGEVMGRVISLSVASRPREGFNPLAVMSHVMAHEVFHLWNSTIEIAEENLWQFEWFNEGFGAEYASWLGGLRLGDIDEASFLRQLGQAWSQYAAKRDGKITLVSAGKDKASNEGLIYSGGLIAAATLDFRIRSESAGKRSLDELWPYMLKTFPRGSAPLSLDKLADAVRKLYGDDTAHALMAYVTQPAVIPLADAARRVGLRAKIGSDGKQLTLSRDTEATEARQRLWTELISR